MTQEADSYYRFSGRRHVRPMRDSPVKILDRRGSPETTSPTRYAAATAPRRSCSPLFINRRLTWVSRSSW